MSTISRARDRAGGAALEFEKRRALPVFFLLSQLTLDAIATTTARSTFVVCVSSWIAALDCEPQLIFSITTMRLLFGGLRSRMAPWLPAFAAVSVAMPKRYQCSRARTP